LLKRIALVITPEINQIIHIIKINENIFSNEIDGLNSNIKNERAKP
jgi:hypothetical protein